MKQQESVRYNALHERHLRNLVAKGEGHTLEFKRKAAFPEKIVREMIAFANTSGGVLLVGVGDDGSIPGLKYPDEESHVISQALAKTKPLIDVNETFIPLGNSRVVLQYEIAESTKKPHFVLAGDQSKECFVRVGDKTIKASREVREIIKQKRKQRNIRFSYGDHEKFLMQYLEENKSITLKEFVKASGLKRFHASNKLILLVLANVLSIAPHENGDRYSLAFGKL